MLNGCLDIKIYFLRRLFASITGDRRLALLSSINGTYCYAKSNYRIFEINFADSKEVLAKKYKHHFKKILFCDIKTCF